MSAIGKMAEFIFSKHMPESQQSERAAVTARRLAGVAMIASPFVAVFVFAAIKAGVLAAIGIFALVVVTIGVIGLGVHLLDNQ